MLHCLLAMIGSCVAFYKVGRQLEIKINDFNSIKLGKNGGTEKTAIGVYRYAASKSEPNCAI